MKNQNLILATNTNGEKITIQTIEEWIEKENKKELANFFFDRFYVRYLKPFEFEDDEFTKSYKNGFAIMTSCCLLIETFVSYTKLEFKDTSYKSERCFGYFFSKHKEFNCFAKGGLEINQYENLITKKLNNKGIPRDFYKNVRCGILHNGETKNNWKIIRSGKLFNEKNKSINATIFLKHLKNIILQFQNELIKSDFNNSEVWTTYKARLKFLIEKSHSE